MALSARREVFWRKNLELKITISRRVGDQYNIRPMWIDTKRQVSALIIQYSFTNLHCQSYYSVGNRYDY
jgi:hypothetical protein